jgi:nucleotide-binding universal stress UspA family protein
MWPATHGLESFVDLDLAQCRRLAPCEGRQRVSSTIMRPTVTYQRLMVHVDPSPDTGHRLSLAVELARSLDATLVGFSAAATGQPLTLSSGLPAPLLAERNANLVSALEALERNFVLLANGARTEWVSATAPPVAFAAEHARTADLLIVGRGLETWDHQDFYLSPASLLLAAGRPVLIVPPNTASLSVDRIVVAWKASPSARAAVQQALPLLILARHVTVLGVGEEVDQGELEDVCVYLRAHGVEAHPHWLPPGKKPVADAIVEWADTERVGLVVCGGYGRARAVEWVFGGVTQALLEHSPVCCLMAH